VSTFGRGKRAAISMATSTPARTTWVMDDESFWACARRHLTEMSTTNKSTRSFCSGDSSSSDIAGGSMVGLKTAERKLGWSCKDWPCSSRGSGGHQRGWCANSKVCLAQRLVPEIGVEFGHLETLNWAVTDQRCPLSPFVWFFAEKGGSLDVLEWLRSHRCPKDLYSCAAGAAAGGSLEALKWSRRRGHGRDRFVPYSAARAGNLELLRWATWQGCPWDRHWCAEVAAANGHSAIVEWVNNRQE